MQARTCWSALEYKAEVAVDQTLGHIVKARQVHSTLQSSHQRLLVLYQEYRSQSLAQQDSRGMKEATEQRQFMSQLLTLRKRLERDIANAEHHLQQLQQHMTALETQRIKMKTLREADHRAVSAFRQKREQRQMDELGVMQFNRRVTP
ncbi:MAG: flagellar export protein FliJ [Rhodoferax sp.]